MSALVSTVSASVVCTDPAVLRHEDAICVLELLLLLEELARWAPAATEVALRMIGLDAYLPQELCADVRRHLEPLAQALGMKPKEPAR